MALSFVFLVLARSTAAANLPLFASTNFCFFSKEISQLPNPKWHVVVRKKLHSNIFVVFRSPQFSQKFQIVVEANSNLQSIYKVAKITVIVFLKSFLLRRLGEVFQSTQIQYHQRCVSYIETLVVKPLFQRPKNSVRTLFCWKKVPICHNDESRSVQKLRLLMSFLLERCNSITVFSWYCCYNVVQETKQFQLS